MRKQLHDLRAQHPGLLRRHDDAHLFAAYGASFFGLPSQKTPSTAPGFIGKARSFFGRRASSSPQDSVKASALPAPAAPARAASSHVSLKRAAKPACSPGPAGRSAFPPLSVTVSGEAFSDSEQEGDLPQPAAAVPMDMSRTAPAALNRGAFAALFVDVPGTPIESPQSSACERSLASSRRGASPAAPPSAQPAPSLETAADAVGRAAAELSCAVAGGPTVGTRVRHCTRGEGVVSKVAAGSGGELMYSVDFDNGLAQTFGEGAVQTLDVLSDDPGGEAGGGAGGGPGDGAGGGAGSAVGEKSSPRHAAAGANSSNPPARACETISASAGGLEPAGPRPAVADAPTDTVVVLELGSAGSESAVGEALAAIDARMVSKLESTAAAVLAASATASPAAAAAAGAASKEVTGSPTALDAAGDQARASAPGVGEPGTGDRRASSAAATAAVAASTLATLDCTRSDVLGADDAGGGAERSNAAAAEAQETRASAADDVDIMPGLATALEHARGVESRQEREQPSAIGVRPPVVPMAHARGAEGPAQAVRGEGEADGGPDDEAKEEVVVCGEDADASPVVDASAGKASPSPAATLDPTDPTSVHRWLRKLQPGQTVWVAAALSEEPRDDGNGGAVEGEEGEVVSNNPFFCVMHVRIGEAVLERQYADLQPPPALAAAAAAAAEHAPSPLRAETDAVATALAELTVKVRDLTSSIDPTANAPAARTPVPLLPWESGKFTREGRHASPRVDAMSSPSNGALSSSPGGTLSPDVTDRLTPRGSSAGGVALARAQAARSASSKRRASSPSRPRPRSKREVSSRPSSDSRVETLRASASKGPRAAVSAGGARPKARKEENSKRAPGPGAARSASAARRVV